VLEAIVGVALRAILASVFLGGVLAALVLLATRALALTASTRHALWTTALIATAVMPLAGIGVSLARATVAPATASSSFTPAGTLSGTFDGSHAALDHRTRAAEHAANASAAPAAAAAAPHGVVGFFAPGAAWLLDRLSVTRWTPRMSRVLAETVAGVWALGALIGLIGLAASIVRVRGLKRRSSPLDGALADELPWLTEVGPGREIYLRLSFETETPVAIGFRRPVILIPTELATADGLAAIESLVLHEHAHLRRYDDWTNLVQRVIERLFWFNPIVWLVGRRIALEREIASDDAVVEKTGEAHAYATSLWKLAREMRMPEHAVVAPGALLTRKQITVRIEQLLDKKRARLHRSPSAALGVALASLAAVAFVATSAPAVELPAAEAPVATSAGSTSAHPAARTASANHAGASHRAAPQVQTVHKYVIAAAPAGIANRAAASGSNAQPNATTTIAYERVVRSNGGTSTTVREQRFAPVARGGARGIPDAQSGKATGVANAPAHTGVAVPAAPGPGSAQAVPPVPAVPAVPPVPAAPATAALPAIPKVVLNSDQLARLHQKVQAAARAVHAVDSDDFGGDIAKELQSTLATLPRQIAQESSNTRHTRMDGVKISRELVASCVACSFRNADVRGVDLHGLTLNADDFTGADMRGVNLSGAQLTGVSLSRANLANADLRNAQLNGTELRSAILDGAQLDGIRLVGVSLKGISVRGVALRSLINNCTGCDFAHFDLRGQDLHGITLNGAALTDADLRGANLAGAQLIGVSLTRANLGKADLRNATLNGSDVHEAIFDGAQLEGIKLTGVSMKHVSLRGTLLRSVLSSCTGCDFANFDLRGQDLHGISLSGANLSHADLRDANLSGVRFSGVDLSKANLAGADLTNARFDGCNLAGVDLHGARTGGLVMQGSSLSD
jgi:uncharacterized protein YjbI with pentapeptide repeats/beta-lactamase regulating signal transducer with metallopeptidase domain